ncbi:MAG: hypothetical protein EOO99_09070 [Pedobacter sp.]|nr:MAG: hypothetical protein EOO99_09070 [Pedobacter sp.]
MENSNNTENKSLDENNDPIRNVPTEHDYEAHATDPKPAPTVNEPDNKGAGPTMKWVIPIVIIVLAIIYFLYFRNTMTD